jgi:hypothetical protein
MIYIFSRRYGVYFTQPFDADNPHIGTSDMKNAHAFRSRGEATVARDTDIQYRSDAGFNDPDWVVGDEEDIEETIEELQRIEKRIERARRAGRVAFAQGTEPMMYGTIYLRNGSVLPTGSIREGDAHILQDFANETDTNPMISLGQFDEEDRACPPMWIESSGTLTVRASDIVAVTLYQHTPDEY